MIPFEWLIIIKSNDFLAILKNSKKKLKNIKFSPQLDFHMKNILSCRIDYLKFKDGETVRNTWVIRAMCSTITKLFLSLSLYIYIERDRDSKTNILLGARSPSVILLKKYQMIFKF
jgi:hypothetical protein